ncbi:arginine deiminase family protein [Streptomyces sp. NPDC051219]|uniref:arginine deiminase family protein n=1 Tax=Streptomyces sp. NPDC051219 TaxID=3155283 RepID=UPI003424ED16
MRPSWPDLRSGGDDLLAETMTVPEARSWLLDRKITANEVGIGLIDGTRAFLETLDPRRLAEYLIGGLATSDLPDEFRPPTSPSSVSRRASGNTSCLRCPTPLHPWHELLAVRGGDAEPAVVAGPSRRDAADEGRLRVPPMTSPAPPCGGVIRNSAGGRRRSRAATSCRSAMVSS